MFLTVISAILITLITFGLVLYTIDKGATSNESVRLIYWVITCISIWFMIFKVGMQIPNMVLFYFIWKIIVSIITFCLLIHRILNGFKKGYDTCDFLVEIMVVITIWFL